MSDTATVESELETREQEYQEIKKRIDQDEVVDDAMPFVYGLLADAARDIAICRLFLDRNDVIDWLQRSAEAKVTKLHTIDEYEDVIEQSYQWQRPTESFEALHIVYLADATNRLREAVGWTEEIDHEWLLAEHPDYQHVLYYAVALASYLDGGKDRTQEFLKKLSESEHGHARFEGLATALQALLDSDESMLHKGIETILETHRDEYRSNPDTAIAFLSIDAMVYLKLAQEAGLPVDRERFPSELREYLPEELPTEK